MKVLLVEDDLSLAHFLEKALCSEAYLVEILSHYQELEDFIRAPYFEPDLAIFDRILGTQDSLSLLKKFQEKLPLTRILFLSILGSPEEKARALEEGADDYMSKPYSLRELMARVKALHRRTNGSSVSYLKKLGNLEVDLLKHVVNIEGQRVSLSSKEFKILSVLIEQEGAILNRYQILDRVWEVGKDIESNVVEATMHNLRKILRKAGSTALVQSKRGFGYWISEQNYRQ
jgi:DNA-binding response OmpR family regulator